VSRLQGQPFKAFKAQSRLRVNGSRRSKQRAGSPYGGTEEGEKEVKAFAAQLIQNAKDPERELQLQAMCSKALRP
jgi:hypothetical protein